LPELPVCSGGEVIRALEHLGFRVVRQRGSHVMLRKGMAGCVVPLHRELKRGTLSGILRQAGVGASEFISTIEK
jgi:predicted RNA binding protein YcfA (HicA-like mRNA interferase family)